MTKLVCKEVSCPARANDSEYGWHFHRAGWLEVRWDYPTSNEWPSSGEVSYFDPYGMPDTEGP